MSRALICAALVPVYGNLFGLLHARLGGRRRAAFAWAGPLVLLAACAGWQRLVRRRGLDQLGLHGTGWGRGAAWGALAGVSLALAPVLWFRMPGRRGPSVRADELRVSPVALALRLFVVTPLLVALVEEVAFRGFVQGRLHHAWGGGRRGWVPVLGSSLSFALWHVTVNIQTLRRTNVVAAGLASFPVALAGGLTAVFGGGLVFGWLYAATGSLVAPVVAHWVVDALMLIALYDWRPSRRTIIPPAHSA